ncbi:MAG: primosomal protein N' [Clostridiales bacterium]|nr:primosomal protein N' [Clostridiales bacterium]
MVAQVIVDVVHSNVAKPFSYAVPPGMKLVPGTRVRVPLGRRQVDGLVVSLMGEEDLPPEMPLAKLKPITGSLEEYPAVLPPLMALAEEIAQSAHCPLAESLRLMLPAAMRTGRIQVKTEEMARLATGVDGVEAAQAQKRSPKRATLLRLLADGKPHLVRELAEMVREPREALKRLEDDGLVRLYREEAYRSPYEDLQTPQSTPPVLTAQQQEALSGMLPQVAKGRGSFLLHGVTGSGKTEVYLALVHKVLEMGRSAIVLVPEIALTPQMVNWFRGRFGPQTAVLHSRLTEGQRYDEWRRIRKGEARVVIGARSAIFAPVQDLGLIVVDEEHEQTYLSDRHPRYDARQVAGSRSSRERATLVLSSATPSILSFAKARRGDYTLVEMPSRVMDRPMPTVTVVDMRREMAAGNRSIFSLPLLEKLGECTRQGQQAMLFLNRRGYNTFVSCRSCGYVVKCDACDISMTLHQPEGGSGQMRCHLCGAVKPPPTQCPSCASPYIRYFGSGTQRVEEELKKLLPGVKALRMDIDTTRERDAHRKILDAFGQGQAQVLIGTQMIAKGLDFPQVTLVGVMAADMSLHLPDYRAQERTFQLITQVAGRAGRANIPGEVVVQTYQPEHPCIQAAAAQDYRTFFTQEFERRRTGLYPPFTMLTRLLVECPREEEAQEMAQRLYEAVQGYLLSHPVQKKRVLMCRLDEAPVKKIRGQYRYHVLLKLFEHPDAKPVLEMLAQLAAVDGESCRVYVEVNPATLM